MSALGLHIEGFDSVAGFERLAARARELKKPIVAMKVGRSEQARAATVSHTASLAGSDAASDAFLKRLGIARVNTIPSFLEALKLLHVAGPLAGYTHVVDELLGRRGFGDGRHRRGPEGPFPEGWRASTGGA